MVFLVVLAEQVRDQKCKCRYDVQIEKVPRDVCGQALGVFRLDTQRVERQCSVSS